MGTLFWLHTNGKYIYGWVILKTQRERQKQTDDRTEKKEKKGGEKTSEKCEKLEAWAEHYYKEGGLLAATRVVSVIVGVRQFMY